MLASLKLTKTKLHSSFMNNRLPVSRPTPTPPPSLISVRKLTAVGLCRPLQTTMLFERFFVCVLFIISQCLYECVFPVWGIQIHANTEDCYSG